jgi:hypothetical protein
MKEKVVCGNLSQLAESIRLATPLARFGKIVRTASKRALRLQQFHPIFVNINVSNKLRIPGDGDQRFQTIVITIPG